MGQWMPPGYTKRRSAQCPRRMWIFSNPCRFGMKPMICFSFTQVSAPVCPSAAQDPEDLLWIREPFLESTEDFGKLVVHGHTALDYPQHFGNRVDLDGGAGYHRPLFPAVFEGRDCWILTGHGRIPLTP